MYLITKYKKLEKQEVGEKSIKSTVTSEGQHRLFQSCGIGVIKNMDTHMVKRMMSEPRRGRKLHKYLFFKSSNRRRRRRTGGGGDEDDWGCCVLGL